MWSQSSIIRAFFQLFTKILVGYKMKRGIFFYAVFTP